MYRSIVLAYDGSRESQLALREGAILARRLGADVHLLSVVNEGAGVMIAESVYPGSVQAMEQTYRDILDEGAERLRALGCSCTAELLVGEPPATIAAYARRVGADLVVVGHRTRGMMQRWWNGSTGAYLLDHLDCSLLMARRDMDHADMEAAI